MLPLLLLLAIACLAGQARAEVTLGRARVQTPVADLRREPVPAGPTLERDPLQESQLLYGDPVTVLEIQGGWARVAAPDQLEWTHNRRWEGYPGWMQAAHLAPEPAGWTPNLVVVEKLVPVRSRPAPDAPGVVTLSLGTRLSGVRHSPDFIKAEPVSDTDWWQLRLLDGSAGWIGGAAVQESKIGTRYLAVPGTDSGIEAAASARARIVAAARLFLGDPYHWGGRSAHDLQEAAPPHTATDCSGLTGLCYQAADVRIPRDAHEQWMRARPISRESIQPADLVFLADPENAHRITHVMLYAGEGKVIEGPGTGATVREISLEERLKETAGRRVHYGSYLQ